MLPKLARSSASGVTLPWQHYLSALQSIPASDILQGQFFLFKLNQILVGKHLYPSQYGCGMVCYVNGKEDQKVGFALFENIFEI